MWVHTVEYNGYLYETKWFIVWALLTETAAGGFTTAATCDEQHTSIKETPVSYPASNRKL